MPAISVVIPARDAERFISRTLTAVLAQVVDGGFEVIVVDNGSLDATPDIAEQHGVRVIRRPRGEGPGAARNDGVAAAAAPLVAFTDSDCVPQPGWLQAGIDALRDADLVQGRVQPESDVPRGPFDRTLWVTADEGLYPTANVFVRKALFDAVGGFPAGLEQVGDVPSRSRGGAPFGEDALLAWAIRRAGGRPAFAETAIVEHEVTPRKVGEALAERRRGEMFPALVRRIPELRGAFLYRRMFLSRRHAELALATVGVAAAAATRRPWGLLAAAPLANSTRQHAQRHGLPNAALLVAADAVSAAACVRGSLTARTLVI